MKLSKLVLAMIASVAAASVAQAASNPCAAGDTGCTTTTNTPSIGQRVGQRVSQTVGSVGQTVGQTVNSVGQKAPATAAATTNQITGSGYVQDARGVIVRSNNTGACVRTAYWTPELAKTECEGGVPTPAVVAPVAPPVAPVVEKPVVTAPVVVEAPVVPVPVVVETPKPVTPPVVQPVVAVEKVTVAADALFDTNKTVLKADAKAKLDDLATKVKAITLEVVVVTGHTDSDGSDAFNQKLSVHRAEAVKAYLVSKGVDTKRIYTEGKGEKSPVADNKTKAGKAKNRRVDVEVVGTRTVKK